MVTCPNCRTEAEPAARFCGTCGCNLEQARSTERVERAQVQEQPCEPAQEQRYDPPERAPARQYRQPPEQSRTYQAQQPQQGQYPPQSQQYQQYQQPQQQWAQQQPPQYSQQQYDQRYPQYPQYPSYQYGGQQKSAGIAAVLALVLGLFGVMGIGHMYVGRLSRGFIILIAGLALIAAITITAVLGVAAPVLWAVTLICGIALVLLWIWQTYDAYRLANEYNYSMYRSGRPAW